MEITGVRKGSEGEKEKDRKVQMIPHKDFFSTTESVQDSAEIQR